MTAPTPEPVTVAEITDLLAWARRLTEAGAHTDPAERAAYQQAKAQLLTRITDQHTGTPSTKDAQ